MAGRVVLLTGESQVGKTTICQRAAALAAERGYRCAGILSMPLMKEGKRVGAKALNLANGQERELARTDCMLSNVCYGAWSFNPATLEWGNALFRGLGECDLLIVDEIGPLEFELGSGWVDAWGALERRRFALAVVIARPALAGRVHNLVAAQEQLTALRTTRDELPMQIVNALEVALAERHARR
jgi:nucleoside-triphosphatase